MGLSLFGYVNIAFFETKKMGEAVQDCGFLAHSPRHHCIIQLMAASGSNHLKHNPSSHPNNPPKKHQHSHLMPKYHPIIIIL